MIKRAEIEEADALAALARQLWPEHGPDELSEEFRELITSDDAACFLKYVGS